MDEETATGAYNEVVCVVRDAGHQTQKGRQGDRSKKEEELGAQLLSPQGQLKSASQVAQIYESSVQSWTEAVTRIRQVSGSLSGIRRVGGEVSRIRRRGGAVQGSARRVEHAQGQHGGPRLRGSQEGTLCGVKGRQFQPSTCTYAPFTPSTCT